MKRGSAVASKLCFNRERQRHYNQHCQRIEAYQRPSPRRQHKQLATLRPKSAACLRKSLSPKLKHEPRSKQNLIRILEENLHFVSRLNAAKSLYPTRKMMSQWRQVRSRIKRSKASSRRQEARAGETLPVQVSNRWRLVQQKASRTISKEEGEYRLLAKFQNMKLVLEIAGPRHYKAQYEMGEKKAMRLLRGKYGGSLASLVEDVRLEEGGVELG